MLEAHRANPVCASCHARMDPLGFSLENFDAIGQWRTSDTGAPIDASGVLLDGTRVQGPAALRRALVERKEQFVRAVTGKLATYALGRDMDYFDAPAIRGIVRVAAEGRRSRLRVLDHPCAAGAVPRPARRRYRSLQRSGRGAGRWRRRPLTRIRDIPDGRACEKIRQRC